MTQRWTRRGALAGGLAMLAGTAFADHGGLRPQARPTPDIGGPARPGIRLRARASTADIVAEARLGGRVGFVLTDLRSGRVIDSLAADQPLPPASVTKSVTTLYALDTLGAGHRFDTRLIATGPVEGGVIRGDLILAGGGDPVLSTDDLGDLAAALRTAGVTGVSGRFGVWGGALPYLRDIDPGQLDHLGYNPAISGLNLNFNRVHFEWVRNGSDYRVTMDARAARFRPEVSVARMRVADRSLPVYTYADSDGIDDWTVARAALGDGGSRWLPVRRPALYAGDVFRTLARAQGIALPAALEEASLPPGEVLATHRSARVEDLARDMLLYSTNLTAEVLGLSATVMRNGSVPATLVSSAARMADWAGSALGITGDFVDHSGLGDAARISAAAMTDALLAASAGSLRPLLRDIPMTDANGDPLRQPPGQIRAKTGTLNFVSALSGYLTNTRGADLAFTIFCADLEARAAGIAAGDELPEGAIAWNNRAKRLQQRLLQHWARVAL